MKKILIVDNYEEIRNLLHSELAEKGLKVSAVSNGMEAEAYLKENDVDLVITAYLMPHMNGAELIACINNQFPLLPIVLLSMISPGEIDIELKNYHYMPKPFILSQLIKLVDQVLDPLADLPTVLVS